LKIAVLTDALAHRSLDEVLEWCGERDIDGVELGVGGYSPAPHVDAAARSGDHGAPEALAGRVEAAGLEIAALNASGNPLHPDPDVARAHDAVLRDALRLAARLGVARVVAMSGCPGGPGSGRWPVFAGGAWLPDMEGLWEHQFSTVIAPYWSELSAWAQREAPEAAICLELHPGTSIYNPASFALLAEHTGGNVQVNVDPSHFLWQGIDPLVAIDALDGRIGFAHGKDTLMHADRIARDGVLDFRWPGAAEAMPWHFCAVGRGRPVDEWRALLETLAATGYDGPISIEHEDPELTPEDGIEASLDGLRAALAVAVPGTES
jgi:sugar phosphate isomerase/epimerase